MSLRSTLPALVVALSFAQLGAAQPPGKGPGEPLFDSGGLATGESFAWTFNETGLFAYHCEIHPAMKGTVQVGASGTPTAAVGVAASTFTPATVAVTPGGSVTWTNADTATHTVTSDARHPPATTGKVNRTMHEATIDQLPPEKASKGLARAEEARLFARLNYSDGVATGRFVSFTFNEETGEVAGYHVASWNASVFESIETDPWNANGTPRVHGAIFRVEGDETMLGVHNNPTAGIHIVALAGVNVTFSLGAGTTIDANNSTHSAWRLTDGARHGHLALLGNATATSGDATIRVSLAPGDGVLFLAHPASDQAAASSLHGLVANANRLGSVLHVANADGTPVEEEMPLTAHARTTALAKGRAIVTVSSDTSNGKLIVIRFTNETFGGTNLRVTVANESVNATPAPGGDASGAISTMVASGRAGAVVTFTSNATEVAVFVPRFSEQTITIEESAGDGSTPTTTPTDGARSPTQTTPAPRGVPSAGVALMVVAIGALALARRRG